ncbi:MAG TPA: trehalose-phosphatase [Terriglobales bacterium]
MNHFRLPLDLPQFKRVGTPDMSERKSRPACWIMPSSFAMQLANAQQRLLLLDYDGTLAPFAPDRVNALPYPGVPQLLEQINKTTGTRVVLISGRPALDVPRLIGINPPLEVWGSHGLERLHPDGRYEVPEIGREILDCLERAVVEFDSLGLRQVTEIKPCAIAVHWRWLPTSKLEEVKATAYRILSPATRNPELRLEAFDGGIELRLRGRNKGDAVQTILSEVGEHVPVAYLGDDITDEDAFRALSGRGLSIVVTQRYRFSAAQVWLKPPNELVLFLKDWINACEGQT